MVFKSNYPVLPIIKRNMDGKFYFHMLADTPLTFSIYDSQGRLLKAIAGKCVIRGQSYNAERLVIPFRVYVLKVASAVNPELLVTQFVK